MTQEPDEVELAAKVLVRGIQEHHASLLATGDEDARNAVIVKSIALLVLAFGMPAREGEEADPVDALEKLAIALGIIDACEKRSVCEISKRTRMH